MSRILVLGLVVAAAGVSGGPGSRPLRADSNLVLIGATVVDGADRFVTGLRREDFRISEGGVEQRIVSLSSEDAPVSAVVVFDASGSMARAIPMASQALHQFLEAANPADEFSVVTVRSRPALSLGFVGDPRDVVAGLGEVRGAGETALFDSVYMALSQVRRAHNARKALLVISDGGDNHSRYTERELIDALREADVKVYAIGLGDEQPEFSGEVLGALADATGGRYFEAWSAKDLPGIMKRIDIRSEYVLGYSPDPLKADGKYHRVELSLTRQARARHLHAFWRRGYYAPSLLAAR
jgi:Ca-activated chloride channel family protein